MYNRITALAVSIGRESFELFVELLKVMVPVMIAVRVAVQFGVLEYVSAAFEPLMTLVGLPREMGIVWATGLFVSTYGAVAAFIELLPTTDLTVAQASVLGGMLLIAHGLPMEQGIVRRAGAGIVATSVLRIAGALLYGWLLRVAYDALGYLQEPLSLTWLPETQSDPGWLEWIWNSAISLAIFFGIILVLIVFLKILDAVGVTRLLTEQLSPFLRIMGIDGEATTLTMIGVLLGIGFGGSLILRESKSGRLAPRTVFLAIVLMGFCHGLIEDTLVFMAIGTDVTASLIGRILFSVLVMMVISRIVAAVPDRIFFRFLFSRSVAEAAARTRSNRVQAE